MYISCTVAPVSQSGKTERFYGPFRVVLALRDPPATPRCCRFFHDLGTVFGFINSDLDSKIAIMEEYRANPKVAKHYEGLCSMIAFEKSSKAIEDQSKPSGSRTLLRLHRALEFVARLFQ